MNSHVSNPFLVYRTVVRIDVDWKTPRSSRRRQQRISRLNWDLVCQEECRRNCFPLCSQHRILCELRSESPTLNSQLTCHFRLSDPCPVTTLRPLASCLATLGVALSPREESSTNLESRWPRIHVTFLLWLLILSSCFHQTHGQDRKQARRQGQEEKAKVNRVSQSA